MLSSGKGVSADSAHMFPEIFTKRSATWFFPLLASPLQPVLVLLANGITLMRVRENEIEGIERLVVDSIRPKTGPSLDEVRMILSVGRSGH